MYITYNMKIKNSSAYLLSKKQRSVKLTTIGLEARTSSIFGILVLIQAKLVHCPCMLQQNRLATIYDNIAKLSPSPSSSLAGQAELALFLLNPATPPPTPARECLFFSISQ